MSYLFFLRELAGRIDNDWSSVYSTLEEMRQALVNRASMLFNVTVDETGWEKVRPYLASFAGKIPAGPTGAEADIAGNLLTDMKIPEYEGLIVPSQ
ncbi:MAG: hypothetical protein JRC53_05715, partial [Deltaproteobacteria bacterium]|nr:hypothetical protein [Deltaproteobacteria bacterium]